jgi:hypothetical protein
VDGSQAIHPPSHALRLPLLRSQQSRALYLSLLEALLAQCGNIGFWVATRPLQWPRALEEPLHCLPGDPNSAALQHSSTMEVR